MKILIKHVAFALLVGASIAKRATAQTSDSLPTVDEVVARMVQQDAARRTQPGSYTATRRYVALNGKRRAEMLVEVKCASDGEKQFNIMSEEGSSAIRERVFYKMLSEETEASSRNASTTHIAPANYEFRLIGKERVNERPAYVLQLIPKSDKSSLINGRIWVDTADNSIVRIEGSPARNPSFWIRSAHFVQTYQKVGPFWLGASIHSINEIRIFGEADLTIETSHYKLDPPGDRAAKAEYSAEVPR